MTANNLLLNLNGDRYEDCSFSALDLLPEATYEPLEHTRQCLTLSKKTILDILGPPVFKNLKDSITICQWPIWDSKAIEKILVVLKATELTNLSQPHIERWNKIDLNTSLYLNIYAHTPIASIQLKRILKTRIKPLKDRSLKNKINIFTSLNF